MKINLMDLQEIIESVAAEAEGPVEITPAFTVECANYTRRVALTNLDRTEMTAVVQELTRHSLSKMPNRLDAIAFRRSTLDLCSDPFGLCDDAAITILEGRKMYGAAKKVKASQAAVLAELKK